MEYSIIEQAIRDVWESSDRTTQLTFDYLPNFNFIALYIRKEHKILVEVESVISSFRSSIENQVPLATYAKIVMFHELGHSVDNLFDLHHNERTEMILRLKNEKLTKSTAYQIERAYVNSILRSEIRAWKWARRRISSDISREEFYLVMRACIDNYKKTFASVLER